MVKLACARTNRALGAWADDAPKADAIERACREMADGLLDAHVVVDALQGGAGTSTNMNVNEVLANRALRDPRRAAGRLRAASLRSTTQPPPVHQRHLPHGAAAGRHPPAARARREVVALQEAFQAKEQASPTS